MVGIKGVILDVDGVLVGNRPQYNWPMPHDDVIHALKSLRSQGLVISLCTGKGTFAIKKIVEKAHLNNLHIGDGGAVVIDFLNNKIIDKHFIPTTLIQQVIKKYQSKNTYLELYTINGYYVQEDSIGEITEKHAAILYREPTIVPSLIEEVPKLEVLKIMPVAKNEENKKNIITIFDQFKKQLSLQWGIHPTALPAQFGIITTKGISKKQSAEVISQATHIPLDQMLGVGDSMTDWEFMQLCGYTGAMGNASEDLKKLVAKKNNGYIGKTVNENGVLDIFKHFHLI